MARPRVSLCLLPFAPLFVFAVSVSSVFSQNVQPMAKNKAGDKEIERAVEKLFLRETDYEAEAQVEAAGSRATPYLVKALRDVKRVTKRFGKADEFVTPRSPLDRIADLVSRDHLPEIVEPLVELLQHDDEEVRKDASLALGVLSSEKCVAPVIKALSDSDEYVVSSALIGIKRALENDRFDADFMAKIFPVLHDMARKKDVSGDKAVPALMLAIERKRAVDCLVAADVLAPDNRQAHYVLRALNKAEAKVAHDRLLPFLRDVKPLAVKWPLNDAYAEALKAYGRNPDENAAQHLRSEIENADERIQAAAAEGLAGLLGVSDALRFVYRKQEELGFDGMSSPQQHYMAVYLCNAEVNNGGFSVYFVNSSAESWREALAGYRAIGAVERERLLQKAIDLFGPKGPALTKRGRDKQRATWLEEHDKTLDALSSEYYECKENVKALLARYAAAHHRHFHD